MPDYETDDDRAAERGIASAFEGHYRDGGISLVEREKFATTDYQILKHDIPYGEAEIKSRGYPAAIIDPVWVPIRKFWALLDAAGDGAPLFIIGTSDGHLYWIDLRSVMPGSNDHPCVEGGRTDRPEAANDIEYMIEVPLKHWTQIR